MPSKKDWWPICGQADLRAAGRADAAGPALLQQWCTSHAILEYREAAFRNGAGHFIVKGESTGVEVIGLVESLLRTPSLH
jgi:hypothetical protein